MEVALLTTSLKSVSEGLEYRSNSVITVCKVHSKNREKAMLSTVSAVRRLFRNALLYITRP